MKFDFVQNNFQNQIDDEEFDEYFKFLLQIIDYEFIRETQSQYNNLSNNEIYKLINKDKKTDIIVSNKHVQIIIQNFNFDYIFYKNNYILNNSNFKTKSINEILDQYLLDPQKAIIYSKDHAKLLTKNNLFDIDFYKSHYEDLNKKSPYELVTHYLKYGKKEGRIVCNEHAQKLTSD